jgi:G3E family GTPase
MVIPVTVFTGFLGSGKTTIISNLVDQLQDAGLQTVYIKNEIGNESIDGVLLRGKHIETKELLNGCICCTLVGPFIVAINEIIERFHPARILVEASGAADPEALALMIDGHPHLQRDGILTIIDVVHFEGYKDLSVAAREQTKFTDLIVFNKVELADLQRKRAVVAYVRELNDHSPIIEAPSGKLSPSVVFGVDTTALDMILHTLSPSVHGEGGHPDHLQADGITAVSIELPVKVTSSQLDRFLASLSATVFRVKGLINTSDQGVVLVNKV